MGHSRFGWFDMPYLWLFVLINSPVKSEAFISSDHPVISISSDETCNGTLSADNGKKKIQIFVEQTCFGTVAVAGQLFNPDSR